MRTEYDIAIIGGGMAGASLACALAGRNLDLALLEARPPGEPGGQGQDDRGIALSVFSRKVFQAMGLWPKLAQSACPIEQIHVSARGRYGCVRMSAGLLGLDALGFVVSARELGRVLFDEMSGHADIDLLCPAAAAGIEQRDDSVAVRVRQAGREAAFRCKLLVIADGAFSDSRELAGIKARIHNYHQTAVVGNVTVSGEHRNTAYERFTPDGLIALLPLGDNRCVTVTVLPEDRADDYLKAGDDACLERLQQGFGKRLGTFSRPGARKSWPLLLLEAERQASGRIVLLGNAAHTVHPNGAQGFNLVLRDLAELVRRLDEALREGADPGDRLMLAAYAASRKADQKQVICFTHALQKAFNTTNPLTALARNSAAFALDSLPALKKEFIKRGTGLHVAPPRLGGSSA